VARRERLTACGSRYTRVGAQAVRLGDGRVLVWGGVDETDDRGTSLGEIYDPATGRFRPAPVLPELTTKAIRALVVPPQEGTVTPSPYAETLVALPDGGALLVDAQSTWGDVLVSRTMRYDADRDDWRQIGSLYATTDWWDVDGSGHHWGTTRPDGVIVPLPDGGVLFAGGSRKRAAELLDPDAETWSTLPKLPAARPAAVGLVLDDGSVLVVPSGGYTDAFRLVLAP
jgi:hypothetical protein